MLEGGGCRRKSAEIFAAQVAAENERHAAFYGFSLSVGLAYTLSVFLCVSVAHEEILETFLERDELIVPGAFVGVHDKERQGADARIILPRQGPWPEDVVKDALGYGIVACFLDDPARTELGVSSAVADTVGFCKIMQKAAGMHFRDVDLQAFFPGHAGHSRGDARYECAVGADIVQHVILVPQVVAFLFAGDESLPVGEKQLRRGSEGREDTGGFLAFPRKGGSDVLHGEVNAILRPHWQGTEAAAGGSFFLTCEKKTENLTSPEEFCLPQGERMRDDDCQIRLARPDDAAALLEIYAPYVRDTAITFEYALPSLEEFQRRILSVEERYPYLVAERNGHITGYAYASRFKERAAYGWDVETSIYLSMDERHHGLGWLLYEKLEAVLRLQGVVNLHACITSAPDGDSRVPGDSPAFHESHGYAFAGRFRSCGYKFGRWYDVIWMEKAIGEHASPMKSVRPLPEIREELILLGIES